MDSQMPASILTRVSLVLVSLVLCYKIHHLVLEEGFLDPDLPLVWSQC